MGTYDIYPAQDIPETVRCSEDFYQRVKIGDVFRINGKQCEVVGFHSVSVGPDGEIIGSHQIVRHVKVKKYVQQPR